MERTQTGLSLIMLVVNIVIGLLAIAALGALATDVWQWPWYIAYPVVGAIILITRSLLSPLAVWGAIAAWHWPWWGAILVFMWPWVLWGVTMVFAGGYNIIRREQ
jgi:hypothetical protein